MLLHVLLNEETDMDSNSTIRAFEGWDGISNGEGSGYAGSEGSGYACTNGGGSGC